jgi:hypothetical protein
MLHDAACFTLCQEREKEAVMETGSGLSALQNMGAGTSILMLIVSIVEIVAMWKVFVKAGQPGWAILIPIYNAIVFLKIAGKPAWWFLLMLIPVVNIVIAIIATIAFAEKFGKEVGFAIGLLILGFIFYPVLAFGSAKYKGAK